MKKNQAQKFIVLFLFFLFAYSWRVEAQTGKEKQLTMELKRYRDIKCFLSTMKSVLILLQEK